MLTKFNLQFLALADFISQLHPIVSKKELTKEDYATLRSRYCNEKLWKALTEKVNNLLPFNRKYEVISYEITGCETSLEGEINSYSVPFQIFFDIEGFMTYSGETGLLPFEKFYLNDDESQPTRYKDANDKGMESIYVDPDENCDIEHIVAHCVVVAADDPGKFRMRMEVDPVKLLHIIQSNQQLN